MAFRTHRFPICVLFVMVKLNKVQGALRRAADAGVRLNKMAILTAHQMGSARLGTSRATSVADPQGQCWDVAGLYICDASALPTSTGEAL